MGTPSYMAPEQARGQRVDHRADVYGLGTILYTVLTGRAPFQEETPQSTILALLNSEPPRPRSLMPSIPPHVELVIERAMAKNPDDRFPDMAAFEQALDALPSLRGSSDGAGRDRARRAGGEQQALRATVRVRRRRERRAATLAVVAAARPCCLLIAAATIAISGVELATGYTFGTVELRLILLCIVGSSITPAVLWVLHIRRKIWTSSSRVLALLGQVRAAVLAGIISYGLLVLSFHVIDDFLLRFLGGPDSKPVGATWTGWNLLLPAVSLVTAVAVAERRRLLISIQPGWRRLLAVWLVSCVAARHRRRARVPRAWSGAPPLTEAREFREPGARGAVMSGSWQLAVRTCEPTR